MKALGQTTSADGSAESVYHVDSFYHQNSYVRKESSVDHIKKTLLSFMKGYGHVLNDHCILANPEVRFSHEEYNKGVADYHEQLCDSIHKLTGHRPKVQNEKDYGWVIRWWN